MKTNLTQRRKVIQRKDARQQNTILCAFAYLAPLREKTKALSVLA